eukprot:2263792-Prymnesium_polylepis.1
MRGQTQPRPRRRRATCAGGMAASSCVEPQRKAAPRQRLLVRHLDAVLAGDGDGVWGVGARGARGVAAEDAALARWALPRAHLYDDRHAAHKHALVLPRREAVARGREAKLRGGVVADVLGGGHLLLHAVVERHDEQPRIVAVGPVDRLPHAERVVPPPVEVHLAREEEQPAEVAFAQRRAQRARVQRGLPALLRAALGGAAAHIAVEPRGEPSVHLGHLAMEGRHRHVVAHPVVPLAVAIDEWGGARCAPVVDEDERLRLAHRPTDVAVALVLRHHHDVVTAAAPLPVGPRGAHVADGVAERLVRGRREVLEVVAVRVVAEREVERDEEEVGLLRVERPVARAQQLLVQHHVDAVPVVARPVALAVRRQPRREARRHVVHVDARPRARRVASSCGGRGERRRAERAVGTPRARRALAPVVNALAAARAL